MELDHVEAFVAIVRRGGFTRAAATLHLSQPAISRRVHLLEHELGAPLFDRIRSGAALGTLASTLLTERLRRFREAFPAIDLRMRTALSREVSELVRRADATLGLRYEADPDPELVSTTLPRSGWWRCARHAIGWRGRDA